MQLNVKFNLVKAETSLIAFVIKGLFLKKNVLISVLLKASFNSLWDRYICPCCKSTYLDTFQYKVNNLSHVPLTVRFQSFLIILQGFSSYAVISWKI